MKYIILTSLLAFALTNLYTILPKPTFLPTYYTYIYINVYDSWNYYLLVEWILNVSVYGYKVKLGFTHIYTYRNILIFILVGNVVVNINWYEYGHIYKRNI